MERNGNKCEKKSGKEREVKGRRGKDRIRKKIWKKAMFKKRNFATLITEKEYCHPNPCDHDGQCVALNNGQGFQCKCSPSFRGPRCSGMQNRDSPETMQRHWCNVTGATSLAKHH